MGEFIGITDHQGDAGRAWHIGRINLLVIRVFEVIINEF